MFRSASHRSRLFTRDAVMFYRVRSACITAGINCMSRVTCNRDTLRPLSILDARRKFRYSATVAFSLISYAARVRAAYLSIKYSRIKLTSTFRRRRRIANNHKGWIGIFVCRYLCIKHPAHIDLLMQRSILINRHWPLCARNQTR